MRTRDIILNLNLESERRLFFTFRSGFKNSEMFIENKFNLKLRGENMETLGLVVGRFQPLHDGHRFLIETAINENENIVIVIGSVGKMDLNKNPLHTDERYRRLGLFLKTVDKKNKKISIILLEDIDSDQQWPAYLKNNSGITDETKNSFYTGDDNLPEEYLKSMESLDFQIRIIERNEFEYEDSNGAVHALTSATEIRNLHKELNFQNL